MTVAARQEQLLDAALAIIVRDGYRAVSIEAIAREVDVTRPVVYGVFDRLDTILHRLLDRQEQRALASLLATISLEPDLSDLDGFLRRTIHDLVALVAGDPVTWRPILLTLEGTPAAVRGRIDRDRDVVRRHIETGVRRVLSAGAHPTGIDSTVVAHALVAICEHFGRLVLEDPEQVDAEHLAGTVSALLTLWQSRSGPARARPARRRG